MSNNKKTFSKEKLQAIQEKLAALEPEEKEPTASEAIAAMATLIQKKRSAGVTDKQILETLEGMGMSVSATTFRNALKPKRQKTTGKKASSKKTTEPASQAEESTGTKKSASQPKNPNLTDEAL